MTEIPDDLLAANLKRLRGYARNIANDGRAVPEEKLYEVWDALPALIAAARILSEIEKMADIGEMERDPRCGCDRWTEGYTCDAHMAKITLAEARRCAATEDA